MTALPSFSPAIVDSIAPSAARPRVVKLARGAGFGLLRHGRRIHASLRRNRVEAQPSHSAVSTTPAPLALLFPKKAARVSSPEPAVAGATVGGKYTLLREAGMGGMGAVWVARNETTGGEVAVKFLLPSAQWSPSLLARLRQEARATASLSHRGVVRVFDLVEAPDGQLFLVLELLHGHTLAERIDAQERIEPSEAVRIALDLLSALEHVHGAGIVHRDIKPPNVFLATDPDGVVTPKLLDFGVSKTRFDAPSLTIRGELVGTPSYMSPEQATGMPVDARSDIFAMGILLYEMISGKNPFAADDNKLFAVVLKADRVVAPEGVSPALWAVIRRALRREPTARFDSAAAMAVALRDAMQKRIVALPRPRPRFVGALVAASLLAVASCTLAVAPPTALSAAHASPRLKMHHPALVLEQSASVRDVDAPAAHVPLATHATPPQSVVLPPRFALDPGF